MIYISVLGQLMCIMKYDQPILILEYHVINESTKPKIYIVFPIMIIVFYRFTASTIFRMISNFNSADCVYMMMDTYEFLSKMCYCYITLRFFTLSDLPPYYINVLLQSKRDPRRLLPRR